MCILMYIVERTYSTYNIAQIGKIKVEEFYLAIEKKLSDRSRKPFFAYYY